VIDKLKVTQAVAELLQQATGLPVGLSHMPKAQPPYYVLYSVDTQLDGAPFSDLNEDMSVVYQITSVSGPDEKVISSTGTLEQAEFMADKARAAFLRRNPVTGRWETALEVTGARVMCRELETEPGGTSDPTDAIISYVQRFRFDLTST
jgi:hypothetical protein